MLDSNWRLNMTAVCFVAGPHLSHICINLFMNKALNLMLSGNVFLE